MEIYIFPCLSCLPNRYRSSFSVGRNISKYQANAIDWLALAIVGKIFAFEFITHSTGGKEERIKYARNSWLRESKRIYLDVQSSFWCRAASAAPHFCELQREKAHTRDSVVCVANDVSCNKAGEMAEKTTVTTGIVGTDVTRIWTGNTLLRQQLRICAICLTRQRKTRFSYDVNGTFYAP